MNDTRHNSSHLAAALARLVPHRAPAAADPADGRAVESRRLRAMRLSLRQDVIADATDPIPVGLYVLVKQGSDVAGRRAVALAHAPRLGRAVADSYVDDAWQTDPAARPVLAQAHAALRRKKIRGLLCVSQADISPSASVYEPYLRQLHSAHGFLDLAHDEPHL
ncbi:hypothetical protein [Streptomyces venezuelae]|uniref:hypothetical protein n=1 Tax=Streptomyces venezuelae TaxID=54571 RepID=UPI00343DBF39